MVIQMLENVRQVTIRPLIERFIAPGTRVYTDEYDIYRRLPEWGFDHRTGATAGANTPAMTTATAFTRSMSHRRGVLVVVALVVATPIGEFHKKNCPLYLGFFQFVHNVRIRGKGLLKPFCNWWWRNHPNCPKLHIEPRCLKDRYPNHFSR